MFTNKMQICFLIFLCFTPCFTFPLYTFRTATCSETPSAPTQKHTHTHTDSDSAGGLNTPSLISLSPLEGSCGSASAPSLAASDPIILFYNCCMMTIIQSCDSFLVQEQWWIIRPVFWTDRSSYLQKLKLVLQTYCSKMVARFLDGGQRCSSKFSSQLQIFHLA